MCSSDLICRCHAGGCVRLSVLGLQCLRSAPSIFRRGRHVQTPASKPHVPRRVITSPLNTDASRHCRPSVSLIRTPTPPHTHPGLCCCKSACFTSSGVSVSLSMRCLKLCVDMPGFIRGVSGCSSEVAPIRRQSPSCLRAHLQLNGPL